MKINVATVCGMTDLGTIDGRHPPHGSAAKGMLPHDMRAQLGNAESDPSRPYYPSTLFTEAAFPAAMGHEASATITELGVVANSATRLVFPDQPLAVGDRVATYRVHGAYGEYSALTTDNLVKVPPSIDDEEASLIEPLIANYNCLRRCWSIREPRTVLVIGQGCQGLFATQLVRALGADFVAVSEPSTFKRQLALELGADVALNPQEVNLVHEVEALTAGRGFDLVVECVGSEATVRSVPFLVRRGGMVAQIGAVTNPITFDYGYVHFKHFIVVPADYFPTLRDISDQVADLLALIENRTIQPRRVITHRAGLDEIGEIFDLARRQPEGFVKAAIHLSGASGR